MSKTIAASRFKAECLGILDEVAETGESLIVTKRGLPVATIAPVKPPVSLRGSVMFKVSDEELMAPLPERWDAALPDAER